MGKNVNQTMPKQIVSSFERFSKTLPLLRAGELEVRLAKNEEDVRAAQLLRYEVFYEECGATANETVTRLKQDIEKIDDFCDILLVIDHSNNKIVGTYRFMLREAAQQYGGYYTAGEFDIHKLVTFPGQIMELGRSCVHKNYRTKPTMQLLWRGIGAYIQLNQVSLCFGCGSFQGTDLSKYNHALSYLYYKHLAPLELRARALSDHYQAMNFLPPKEVNPKIAMKQLPPLIKGYLRLGGFIGDGIFIDRTFNSIDVCIIVRMETVTERYFQRYIEEDI
jgi:putative hemolysin